MKKSYVPVLVVLSAIFLMLAVCYWVMPAKSLPSFFPGHEALVARRHFKHGLAAFILSAGLAIWAWFASGSKPTSEQSKPKE